MTASALPSPKRERLWRLDVCRAVAVLLVIGHHSGYAGEGLPGALAAIFRAWNLGGWVGVDLFFVLSGLLVSRQLLDEVGARGSARTGRFLIRRAFKIYPAFYVYLIVVIAWWLLRSGSVDGATIASEALFVQNYGPRFLVHTWSLAVEEHFYLLLAGIFTIAPAWFVRRRVFVGVVVSVTMATLAGRVLTTIWWPALEEMRYYTHLRLDSLMAGVTIAFALANAPAWLRPVTTHRAAAAFAAVALVAPAAFVSGGHPLMRTLGVTALWIAFGVIVTLAATPLRERAPAAVERGLAFVGRHSYSIYLWHLPVRLWLPEPAQGAGAAAGLVWFVAYAAISLAIGVLMARLIEFPAVRRGARGRGTEVFSTPPSP